MYPLSFSPSAASSSTRWAAWPVADTPSFSRALIASWTILLQPSKGGRAMANSKKLVVARVGRMGALLARVRTMSLTENGRALHPATPARWLVLLGAGPSAPPAAIAALTPGAGKRTLGPHVT